MAFFKSKTEKELIAKMERDEQMQVFNDQINELKTKRQEYVKIAAEAEVNGDDGTYDVAVNALVELNNVISSLNQTKANFDIINVSNSISTTMATAFNTLDKMATGSSKMPNIRKIQKANLKLNKFMRNLKISQKAMSSVMKQSNPANKARSSAEIESVKPMIDAEVSKMIGGSTLGLNKAAKDVKVEQASEGSGDDLALYNEIMAEKNRII